MKVYLVEVDFGDAWSVMYVASSREKADSWVKKVFDEKPAWFGRTFGGGRKDDFDVHELEVDEDD